MSTTHESGDELLVDQAEELTYRAELWHMFPTNPLCAEAAADAANDIHASMAVRGHGQPFVIGVQLGLIIGEFYGRLSGQNQTQRALREAIDEADPDNCPDAVVDRMNFLADYTDDYEKALLIFNRRHIASPNPEEDNDD